MALGAYRLLDELGFLCHETRRLVLLGALHGQEFSECNHIIRTNWSMLA